MSEQLHALQLAADKLEIIEIINRYAIHFDSRELDAFNSLFAEDCHWSLRVPNRLEPIASIDCRSDLMARIVDAMDNMGEADISVGSFHLQTGTVFDSLSATTAQTRTLVIILNQEFSDDGAELDPLNWFTRMQTQIPFGGVYHDQFQRVGDKWKFSERIFLPTAYVRPK